MTTFEKIHGYIQGLSIIDTHEHLPAREERRDQDTDVLREYLSHYFNCDLISAGLPLSSMKKIQERDLSVMQKWELVEPYWQAAQYTGYGRSLALSAKILYGIPAIRRDTIEALNAAFQASLKPGHYKHVLKDTANIRTSILGGWDIDIDREFFHDTVYLHSYLLPPDLAYMSNLCGQYGLPMNSLEDYLEAMDRDIEASFTRGAICYKCALAYMRSLHFPMASHQEAEKAFANLRASDDVHQILQPSDDFQNYVMHHILQTAQQKGRTIQFHTGLQEGNGNILRNSDPTLLTNLFMRYNHITFDLFHMSYPFMLLAGALCKNFANVTLDMCWGHIISPTAAVNALAEWLDAVPYNKISAFGGDYIIIDGVAGHAAMARENVARSLTIKVDQGVMGVDDACMIAKAMFVDNPIRIFQIKDL